MFATNSPRKQPCWKKKISFFSLQIRCRQGVLIRRLIRLKCASEAATLLGQSDATQPRRHPPSVTENSVLCLVISAGTFGCQSCFAGHYWTWRFKIAARSILAEWKPVESMDSLDSRVLRSLRVSLQLFCKPGMKRKFVSSRSGTPVVFFVGSFLGRILYRLVECNPVLGQPLNRSAQGRRKCNG